MQESSKEIFQHCKELLCYSKIQWFQSKIISKYQKGSSFFVIYIDLLQLSLGSILLCQQILLMIPWPVKLTDYVEIDNRVECVWGMEHITFVPRTLKLNPFLPTLFVPLLLHVRHISLALSLGLHHTVCATLYRAFIINESISGLPPKHTLLHWRGIYLWPIIYNRTKWASQMGFFRGQRARVTT